MQCGLKPKKQLHIIAEKQKTSTKKGWSYFSQVRKLRRELVMVKVEPGSESSKVASADAILDSLFSKIKDKVKDEPPSTDDEEDSEEDSGSGDESDEEEEGKIKLVLLFVIG